MGTNYYLTRDACEHCGRGEDKLHIGKSSGGWCFGLHVGEEWEDDVPSSLPGWVDLWTMPGGVITNEYGEEVTPANMFSIITDRSYISTDGFRDNGWLKSNSAAPGPNGLVRHLVDGQFCVRHGDGTWDLMRGVFF